MGGLEKIEPGKINYYDIRVQEDLFQKWVVMEDWEDLLQTHVSSGGAKHAELFMTRMMKLQTGLTPSSSSSSKSPIEL